MITYTFCECAWCDILVTWLRRLMGWVIILYTGWWLVSVSVGGVQAGLQTIIPITICTTGRETRLTHCTVSPCHCHTHTPQPTPSHPLQPQSSPQDAAAVRQISYKSRVRVRVVWWHQQSFMKEDSLWFNPFPSRRCSLSHVFPIIDVVVTWRCW